MFQKMKFVLILSSMLFSNLVWSASGALHLEASRDTTLSQSVEVAAVRGQPPTWETVSDGTRHCKSTPMLQKAVRELVSIPLFSSNSPIWPGNLVNGKDFQDGKFTPITIRRSAGTLQVSGISFKDASTQTSIDVQPSMSESTVAGAIQKIMSKPRSENQEAHRNLSIINVYSPEQVAFELGADARFLDTQFKNALKGQTDGKKNRVLVSFTVTNYVVSYDDPTDPYDVFEKGRKFNDAENQIGMDNPPLYIKDVGYGKKIFVIASSQEPAELLKKAVESVFSNAEDIDSYGAVLQNTTLAYFAIGGNSVTAVKPIEAQSPKLMLSEIKKIISEAEDKNSSNSGLPVSYTIHYLTSGAPASLGFATAYDKRECNLIPKRYYSFAFENSCEDEALDVSIIDSAQEEQQVVVGDLDKYAKAADEKIILKVLEKDLVDTCELKLSRTYKDPKTDKDEVLYLQSDGRLLPEEGVFKITHSDVSISKAEIQVMFNRDSGTVRFVKK